MKWMEGPEGRRKHSCILEGQEVAEEDAERKLRQLKSCSVFTTLLQGGCSEIPNGKKKASRRKGGFEVGQEVR